MIKVQLAVMALAAAMFAAASPAVAANFSFTGTLADDNSVQFFDFSVSAASSVAIRSFGYAGGVNGAGDTISNGGFDTVLALFTLPSGNELVRNDDGTFLPADPITGFAYDSRILALLTLGNYRVGLSACCNQPVGNNVFNGYDNAAAVGLFGRTRNWAVDIRNVDMATAAGAVPEPASWAMLIAGFGLTGATMRRRSRMTQPRSVAA